VPQLPGEETLRLEASAQEEPKVAQPDVGRHRDLFLAVVVLGITREVDQEAIAEAERGYGPIVFVPFDHAPAWLARFAAVAFLDRRHHGRVLPYDARGLTRRQSRRRRDAHDEPESEPRSACDARERTFRPQRRAMKAHDRPLARS